MSEKVEHVAIDVGYGYVKGVSSSNKRIIIPTLVGLGFEQQLGSIFNDTKNDNEHNIHVRYNGEDYFVGELAKESRSPSRIYENKRYNNEHFKVILNVVIQLLTEGRTSEVQLSTGVPLSFYKSQAKEARNAFLGLQPIIEWRGGPLKGTTLKNNIKNSMIFPQGVAALHHALKTKDGKFTYPHLMHEGTLIALIDIGFRTTDVVVVEIRQDGSYRPHLGLSQTIDNIGVNSLMDEIRKYYKAQTDSDLSEYHLSRILKNGFINFKGKKIEFDKVIEDKKHEISANIAESLNRFWSDESNLFDEIFLAGGGGMLFSDYLQGYFDNRLKTIENSQFANAVGYLQYGNTFFNRERV